MAGYNWSEGKSNNAVSAEYQNKLPMTRAVKALRDKINVSVKVAKIALEGVGSCEYHHTSKFYNVTNYYDVDEALIGLKACKEAGIALNNDYLITAAFYNDCYNYTDFKQCVLQAKEIKEAS